MSTSLAVHDGALDEIEKDTDENGIAKEKR